MEVGELSLSRDACNGDVLLLISFDVNRLFFELLFDDRAISKRTPNLRCLVASVGLTSTLKRSYLIFHTPKTNKTFFPLGSCILPPPPPE